MYKINIETQQDEKKIYTGKESIKKLEELQLTFIDIESSIKTALIETKKLSAHAYCIEKYTKLIFSFIRTFRDRMVKKGWSYYDKDSNINKTFPPLKNFTLIFAAGDKNVANPNKSPLTKTKKGEPFSELVEDNQNQQLQIIFPDMIPAKKVQTLSKNNNPCWFLLFNKISENKVRVEISLAIGFDEKTQKISSWKERIILPEIVLEETEFNVFEEKELTKFPCYNKEDELNITKKMQ